MQNPFTHTSNAELAGLIEQYPWFAAARVEMCRRAAGEGRSLFAETAAWAGSVRMLYDIAHGLTRDEAEETTVEEVETPVLEAPARKVRVAGGDFFSQDEYDDVSTADDALIAGIARTSGERESVAENPGPVPFCTEPLAQIYAEQGYTAEAKYIYSQLILRFPEKSTYFAALIDELEKE